MNALGPSLAPYVRSSRSLKGLITPVAHWYANLMGYRRMGLKYDDLRTYLSPFFSVFVVRATSDAGNVFFFLKKWKSYLKYRGYVRARFGRLTGSRRPWAS